MHLFLVLLKPVKPLTMNLSQDRVCDLNLSSLLYLNKHHLAAPRSFVAAILLQPHCDDIVQGVIVGDVPECGSLGTTLSLM